MRWNPVFWKEITVDSRSVRLPVVIFIFNLILSAAAIFNIYNIDTRKVQDGLKILPLDIDKKSSITIDNGNLDDVLNLLEQKNFAEIPIMKLGLSYDFSNDKLNGFVAWILTEGTKHLHHFGLLELSDKELQAELHKIKNNELAQK